MSNCVAFHTQVASIMEVLANAAVAEICKLVDDGYAVLRLEMSQSQKENKALKRKLEMMELKFARRGSARTEAPARAVNDLSSVLKAPVREDDFLHEENAFDNPVDVLQDAPEPADVIDDTSEPCLVKEEHYEEPFRNDDPQEGKILREKLVELRDDSGEKIAVVEKESSPVKSTEELGDELGSRCSVWEVSGLETVLKAEPDKEGVSQRPQLARTDHRAERVTNLGSDYTVCEMPMQSKTFFSERDGGRDTDYQSCMYVEEIDTDKLSVPAQLQRGVATEDGVYIRQSSVRSFSRRTEAATIDSAPVKAGIKTHLWNKGAIPDSIHTQHRQFIDNSLRKVMQQENLNTYETNPQIVCKENMAVSKCIVPDVNLCASLSPAPSKSVDIQCKTGTREKRFLCTFCGKGFSCPKKVEIHQRVHTGEKPFSCTQCRRRFAQSGNLKRHQRVHTGEKPFSCLQCEKRFSHLHQLKMHQRVHTGERPFICTQCGKRFGEKSYLRIHQQKNHITLYSVK